MADLSIPETFTLVEEYYYTDCDYTMTVTQEVHIDGTEFIADLATFTFLNPSQGPILVTFQYPSVTITSLTPFQTLSIVIPLKCKTNVTVSECDGHSWRPNASDWLWIRNVSFPEPNNFAHP